MDGARQAEAMPASKPDMDDYLDLFGRYQKDFGPAYMEPEDERYRFLFDQICRLLVQPSDFNLSMPQEFRQTAQRYLAGDEFTVSHMRDPQIRHFMLSDLYDYVHLRHKMGGKAW
jgi:hypothetical protein